MLEIQRIRLNKSQLAEKLLEIRKADFSNELNEAFRIDELKRIYEEYFDQSRIINIIDSVDVNLDTEEGVTEFKNFNKR